VPRITAYHRPRTFDEALALLAEPGRAAVAGGTSIIHEQAGDPLELVDVQALDMGEIEAVGDGLQIGAAVTLQQIADDERVPDLLRDAARAEEPSTLRTLATIGGGVVGGSADSVVLTALLLFDAVVTFADGSQRPLVRVLHDGVGRSDLIVALELEVGGRTAFAGTARTPRDTPIVAVAARETDRGRVVAMSGVAPTPVLVDPERLSDLDPPADFRGSSTYRAELARVLLGRVLEQMS
jgi:CO/xanthine dehydrogenase FAD-binding subunit